MNELNDIGLLGLGVMGAALARNFEKNGFKVSVFNRTFEKTELFLKNHKGNFNGFEDIGAFVKSLAKPRKIVLMVSAGAPVDQTIAELLPFLEKGDTLMDGGNSFYKDTERRENELAKKGILFLGTGVSGGEKGALEGPSIMTGGSALAWKNFQPLLEKIAAKDFSGGPCIAHLGTGGAGHYIKMVHNGIEYAVMQIISEMYFILKNAYGLENGQIAEVFGQWNKGAMRSYLLEITSKVLQNEVFDHIADIAEQKGTGTWTVEDALAKGIPVPTIAEAVFARGISKMKDVRKTISKPSAQKKWNESEQQKCENTLFAATVIAYAQGFSMLTEFNCNEIARIWQGGCIIRSQLLKDKEKNIELSAVIDKIPDLRETIKSAIDIGAPIPGLASSLQYVETLTTEKLPTSLIQGMRDFFGAHGFQRDDQPGISHGNWEEN